MKRPTLPRVIPLTLAVMLSLQPMLVLAQTLEFRAAVPKLVVGSAAPNQPADPNGGGAAPPVSTPAPVLEVSASAIDFQGVAVGSSARRSLSILNSGNAAASVTVTSQGSSKFGAQHNCSSLAPGARCDLNVDFAPDEPATMTGSLNVNAPGATSRTVSLQGTGLAPRIQLGSVDLAFGAVPVASTADRTVSLTNTGTLAANLGAPSASGAFSVASSTCSTSLLPQASCTLTVRYAPAGAGLATGVLTVAHDLGTATANLSGTGETSGVDVSATALAFDTVDVGASAEKSFQLTNTGTTAVSVTTAASSAPFSAVHNCPPSLPGGHSCDFIVTFAPTAGGQSDQSLVVVTTAGTRTLALGGFARVPTTVALSATPNAGAAPAEDLGTTALGGTSKLLVHIVASGNMGQLATSATLSGSASFTFSRVQKYHAYYQGGSYLADAASCGAATGSQASGTCTGDDLRNGGRHHALYEVSFQPTAGGVQTATLSIAHNATNASPLTLTLTATGSGSKATVTGGVLAYGTATIGSAPVAKTLTLRNDGNQPMTLTGLTGLPSAVTLTSNTCTAVAANAGCTLTATMATGTAGVFDTATVSTVGATVNASVPLTGSVNGTKATVVSGDLAFGSVTQYSTSPTRTLTVRNDGNQAMTLTGLTGLVSAMTVSSNTCTAIAAGSACTMVVTLSTSSIGGPWTSSVATAGASLNASFTVNASVVEPVIAAGGTGVYSVPGTYNFTVPAGITKLHMVVVGGGGGGIIGTNGAASGGGGALAYVNNVAVTPGESLTVVVGAGKASENTNNITAPGGDSYVARAATKLVHAEGGRSATGTSAISSTPGIGGAVRVGAGGAGGSGNKAYYSRQVGGGGAGGYGGPGGKGGGTNSAGSSTMQAAESGQGGAAAGGSGHQTANSRPGGGGGTGLFGWGSDGVAAASPFAGQGGAGGSYLNGTGTTGETGGTASGGFPGGGAGSPNSLNFGSGGHGAVRIIWGTGRAFPNTNVSATP